ncbi:flagellar hook-associated protein 3 FlgL [Melghiribacillus thermohalophilus]|uniref:Flagellar hook-associated protein 3 FlgL n=1 Tax=Melghiribacillus thermohalophilus TaxID=1324956 RepID=A0A4R3MXY4_9BACI|nr:flagellar hook-associated protein FlgL [Melghiribacillus thermohalophilus]TCT20451.1 flagellar hook-associated protein 3 FlgL [Melghiribacillus thermohalophilus]
MRITQSMLAQNFLRNLSRSYDRLGIYQDQLSTGKKITRPSQDPVVAMKGVNYRTELTEIQQYQRNLSEVRSWMDNSDTALDKATKALQRLRELAVQASTDTYETDQRSNIASEIDQLKAHLVDIANTKVNNKYIFNGTKTNVNRFNDDGTINDPSDDPVYIEVSDGVNLQVNVTLGGADPAFSDAMFQRIQDFADDLRDPALSGDDFDHYIDELDGFIQNIVDERADLGARMNRVDLIEDRLSAREVVASRVLSDNEDADIEEVIMNLKTQESVHRAALSVGARIIQPTLIDFLR